jgi:sterol desaturase/sphingolipid hydroxylase (fatty acid hydroxylase superfamily)
MVIVSVSIMALIMMCIEWLRPARAWPDVPGWLGRAVLLNLIQIGIVLLSASVFDSFFQAHRPWSAASLGFGPGVAVGYLAITFVYYFWHRARHASPFLWRWFHQVHHSPERLEILTSFYKHPFEILANGILSSSILFLVVGLEAPEASFVVLMTGLAELVYHWNVRTPRALGFLFQRPEMHRVHHERGRHSDNYSDLPVWDMLFGSYRNPRVDDVECGFGPGREGRLVEMLLGRNVESSRTGRFP